MKELKNRLLWQETNTHRNESCSKYDDCLSEAANKAWHSFSCVDCCEYDPKTVIIEISRESPTEPSMLDRFNVAEFSAMLSAKMRDIGIPIKGTKMGNADWREKMEAAK